MEKMNLHSLLLALPMEMNHPPPRPHNLLEGFTPISSVLLPFSEPLESAGWPHRVSGQLFFQDALPLFSWT